MSSGDFLYTISVTVSTDTCGDTTRPCSISASVVSMEGREEQWRRKSDFSSLILGPEKFEECLGLVREHSLYTEALAIYSDRSSPEYKVYCVYVCESHDPDYLAPLLPCFLFSIVRPLPVPMVSTLQRMIDTEMLG